MTEALAVINDPVVSTVHLVARNPMEMQNAQADLAVWLKNKLVQTQLEIQDLDDALNEARNAGWSVSALTRQRSKALQHDEFYAKLLAAVEAGYTIIPDFPIEVFAIRVERANPREGIVSASWGQPTPNDEKPDILMVGEGEYVHPVPSFYRHDSTRQLGDGKTETRHYASPTGFKDVAFPLRAARVGVMNATNEAMAKKIFDQVGICPAKRKADPLIIGQVLAPKIGKCVSFIIAWYLNLNDL